MDFEEEDREDDIYGIRQSAISASSESKKLLISQKLLKLRYLCKCHL